MKKYLILLLSLCLAFTLFACAGEDTSSSQEESKAESTVSSETESIASSLEASSKEETTEESSEEEKAIFKVKVVDGEGNAIKGVQLQICKNSCIPAFSNDEGIATFYAEITDGYKLSVVKCPEGYEYTGEAEIYLESGITEYTIELSSK